jgi:hypothetical protein
MEKEFVNYEIALALKELGFDEPCFGYHLDNKFQFFADVRSCNTNSEFKFYPTAPTYSQAFRFFREKYKLISYIHPLALLQDTKKWCYEITNFETSWDEDSDLHTPEEAEQACLLELINICKKK